MKIFVDAMGHIPHVSVGDQALIWGAIEILRRKFENAEFIFLCKYPIHERIYLDQMDFNYEIVNRSHNQYVAAYQYRKLAKASDVVISAWGDGFITYPPHLMYRKACCVRTKNTPLTLCSSSMGPFAPSGPKRWLVKAALEKYDYLSVRDTITYKYVKDIGIDNVEMIPDTAFALKPSSSTRIDEIFEVEKIPQDKPCVGINLGIEFMRFCESNEIDFIEICVNIINHFRKTHKCAVVLIPHQYLFEQYDYSSVPNLVFKSHDDRYPIQRVLDTLNSHDDIYSLKDVYTCSELKGVIGRMEVFICNRIHPSVASTSQYVPTAILHYTHKAKGMMDLIGKAEYVWYPKNLTHEKQQDVSTRGLLNMVDRLWEGRDEYREDMQDIMPRIIDKTFSLGDRVGEVINNNGS
jgi:polysaccharide pyruvyl transferase WcaK-like protein